ncbi:MAG: hypothetical protein NTX17_03885 [Candidatus Eisenbacteria bacterium]|nr:hypothetical protein [Candidatus Eisenbacteria bacterium]
MHTRRILLFTVLLLMTPVLATASTARLEGLGVIPDFVEDYANMFAYPVSIARYPGVVIGELGVYGSYDRGFGATMGLGQDYKYGVFGIMLRENSGFAPVPGWTGSYGSQFDLLWGMNFGRAAFGVRVDNSSSEFGYKVGDDYSYTISPLYFLYMYMEDIVPSDENNTGITLSAGFDVRETDKVEAAFEYRTLNFEIDARSGASHEKIQDAGNASYGFRGRGFFNVAENITLVPMVGYSKYDWGWEITSTVPDDEDSGDQALTTMTGGLGVKVDVGSMFMIGVGFSQTKATTDFTYAEAAPAASYPETFEFTSTAAPFLFGCLETPIRDWLTVRFGAQKKLVNEKMTLEFVGPGYEKWDFTTKNGVIPSEFRTYVYEDGGVTMPYFNEPFTFSLGVGFKFGNLDIDATMNDYYPFTGMYWLSGVASTPFSRISATYHY